MTDREDVIRRLKADNLVMSSVPKKTKEEFIAFAQEEFADNYGACLKYVFDFFKLSMTFLQGYDDKLNLILERLDSPKDDEKKIKLLSGNTVKGGKSKDE